MPPYRFSSERAAPWGWVAAGLLLIGVGVGTAAAREPGIAIVVGIDSPLGNVTIDTLRELFLRRQRVWASGEPALPVNLPVDHGVRTAFSQRVLGRLPRDLEGYWGRVYRDGVRPPLVLKTPEAVCAYLETERFAIGYLPLDTVRPQSCRVLLLLDDHPG